jgi:hypothetical protein
VRVTFRDRLKAFEFVSTDGGHEHEAFLRKGMEADFNDFRRFSSKKRNRNPAVWIPYTPAPLCAVTVRLFRMLIKKASTRIKILLIALRQGRLLSARDRLRVRDHFRSRRFPVSSSRAFSVPD